MDYGCGIGEEAVYFAKLGASVTAIDISPVAVEITRKRAIHNNLADRIQVLVMDCTATGFRDRSFELIHGLGILHHVGVEAGLREAKRLLVPGGRAVFLEHMGNCDFVENKLKRWLQIRQRYYSEQEAPVKWRDCAACAGEFKTFRMYPYTLFARLRRMIPALRTRFYQKGGLLHLEGLSAFAVLRFGPFDLPGNLTRRAASKPSRRPAKILRPGAVAGCLTTQSRFAAAPKVIRSPSMTPTRGSQPRT